MKISLMVCAMGWISSFVLAWAWLMDFIVPTWLSLALFLFFVFSGIGGGMFSNYKPGENVSKMTIRHMPDEKK